MKKTIAICLFFLSGVLAMPGEKAFSADLNLVNQELSGYYRVTGSITADNCWVEPGNYAWLVAWTSVTVEPTFEAKAGSEFGIVIGGYENLPQDLDHDDDTLPDWWELYYFGDLGQDGNGDYDGDNVPNYMEHEHETDPTSAGSRPPAGLHYEYDDLGRIKKIERIP